MYILGVSLGVLHYALNFRLICVRHTLVHLPMRVTYKREFEQRTNRQGLGAGMQAVHCSGARSAKRGPENSEGPVIFSFKKNYFKKLTFIFQIIGHSFLSKF